MAEFQPSIGQMSFGAPYGRYEIGDLGEACFRSIMEEIWYAVWNRDQWDWDRRSDPEIPGIVWRQYNWGDCACLDYTCDVCKANFEFGDVRIRWYKYPMRGMSIEQEMTPAQWAEWLPAVLAEIRKCERKSTPKQANPEEGK